jgi:sugar lactone lactonase YvrE
MIKIIIFTAFLVLAPLVSGFEINSNKPVLYQSVDWVTDGVFTQGIEGPAVSKDGSLYAVNLKEQGTIGRITGKNKVEVFIRLPNNSIGNGIRFDSAGNMYVADYVNHNILIVKAESLNKTLTKEVDVYAHSALMNQPNDLAITDDGVIFASDPNWSNGTGNLWQINNARQVTLIEKNMGTTNGIAVSHDNKTLYVNESVQRNVWKYQLDSQGAASDKKLLINFSDHGLDGMRTDQQGNLYIARYGKGVIAIVSSQGKLLREVKLKGKFPTNITFGGSNAKQAFVTMQKRGAIETFFIE